MLPWLRQDERLWVRASLYSAAVLWLLILWPPLAFLLVLAGASALAVRRGATSPETVGAFVEARVSLWLAVTLALVGATLAGLVATDSALQSDLAEAMRAGRPGRAIPAGILAGVSIAALYFGGLDRLVRRAQARFGDYVPAGSTAMLGAGGVPFVVANVVLAPAVEELWYRGLLFGALAPELGGVAAAVAGCAAFGLFHWPGGAWYVLVTGALVGGVCWALRAWDGGLAGPVAAHLTLNLIETVVLRRAARRVARA